MLTLHVASRFTRSYKKMPVRIKENFGEKIEASKRVLFEFEDDNHVLLVNIGSHDDYSKWAKG